MVPVDPEGSFRHASHSRSSRLDRLEEELAKLQSGVEKETRGVGGWTKKWGAVLALVAAIFAVPSGVQDAYQRFWSHTNTTLNANPDQHIAYNPYDKRLSFKVSFSAVNDGSKELDDLTGWGAEVSHEPLQQTEESHEPLQQQVFQPVRHRITETSRSYPFEPADIHCSSRDNSQPQAHIYVYKGRDKTISCTLDGAYLDLFEEPGSYKVEFNVKGSEKTYQLEYCFVLTKSTIEGIKSGGERHLPSTCTRDAP